MKITNPINLTPHAISFRLEDGDIVLEPSGAVARVTMKPGRLGKLKGVPVPVATADEIGQVEGLPEPRPGTYYLVSAMVGAQCRHRRDVLVPGTGPNDEPVREDGRIVAVTRLKFVWTWPKDRPSP